jgi:hypothetical protein
MTHWEEFWRKRSWPNIRHYPGIRLEGLRKTTKTSIRMPGLWAEIWTRDLPNTKQECLPRYHDVRSDVVRKVCPSIGSGNGMFWIKWTIGSQETQEISWRTKLLSASQQELCRCCLDRRLGLARNRLAADRTSASCGSEDTNYVPRCETSLQLVLRVKWTATPSSQPAGRHLPRPTDVPRHVDLGSNFWHPNEESSNQLEFRIFVHFQLEDVSQTANHMSRDGKK